MTAWISPAIPRCPICTGILESDAEPEVCPNSLELDTKPEVCTSCGKTPELWKKTGQVLTPHPETGNRIIGILGQELDRCSKCRGNIAIRQDIYGQYASCFMCGTIVQEAIVQETIIQEIIVQ